MPQITPDELKRLFPNASASCLAANAGLGRVEARLPQRDPAPALVGPGQASQSRVVRVAVRVTLIGARARTLDEDNFVGACKPLRDAIARSFGVDDADPRIEWCYCQLRVRKPEGVIVMIEQL